MIPRAEHEAIKVWLALGGAGLAVTWRMLPAHVRIGVLAVLVAIATVNYGRFGAAFLERVDSYDLIHYYLNAKYFDELGYYDLYPACIAADADAGPKFGNGGQYMAQSEAGDELRPIAEIYPRAAIVKARFSPERWAAFSHDFLYLEREVTGLDRSLWRQMIQDHGYNGTTVWTMIARPITQLVPIEQVKWLCWIDVVLLLVAVGAIAWAYDGTTALWTALFLLVTYSTRWPTMSWALLRYDYVAALLIATALLKRAQHAGAGAAAGYAAAMRFFPAVWLAFPAMKGLWSLYVRKVDKRLLVLAAGFLVAVAVLQGAATVAVGADQVAIHAENLSQHNKSEELSSRRIGLALALNYGGQLEPKNITKAMKANIESQRPLRYGIGLAVMLALGWGLRRRADDEVFAFGFVPFFLFTTASYYYYVTRATLITVHAANLDKDRHAFGLAFLFAIEAFCNHAETTWPGHRVYLIGWLAWALCAYIAAMTVWLIVEDRRTPALEAA